MIKPIKISIDDYLNLKDRSEHYCIKYSIGTIYYIKNNSLHREDGPAIISSYGDKSYYFNGEYYGDQDDYTDESWTRFVKLISFL